MTPPSHPARAGRLAPAAIAFDLDGTLIDSRRDLASAVNLTRADYGLPALDLPAVVAMVGQGAANLVARATAEGVPRERIEEALGRFLEHYGERLLDATGPYPGVPEMLDELGARFPLAVLSNKPEGFSRRILEGLGLAGVFAEIVGGDSLPTRKPDPAGLARIAATLEVAMEEVLLVGDSRTDAETARAAGCPYVHVEWGFGGRAREAGIEAELVVEHPSELVAALEEASG